jgi:hypothetical protein
VYVLYFCMGIEQVMLRESYSTHPGCSCSRQHSPLTADVDQSCSVSLTGALSHPTHPPEAPLPLRASTEYILHYITRYLCVIDMLYMLCCTTTLQCICLNVPHLALKLADSVSHAPTRTQCCVHCGLNTGSAKGKPCQKSINRAVSLWQHAGHV